MTRPKAFAALLLPILLLIPDLFFSQQTGTQVVPTVITNHYGKSEPLSHGVVHVMNKEKKVRVEVKDLAKDATYDVVLLNEANGNRMKIGSLKTNRRGFAATEVDAKAFLETYNALLVMNGEDVIQYAQLQEATHGCICKHSGGSIVTRKLDQECFECPCGVNYEICCGGKKH